MSGSSIPRTFPSDSILVEGTMTQQLETRVADLTEDTDLSKTAVNLLEDDPRPEKLSNEQLRHIIQVALERTEGTLQQYEDKLKSLIDAFNISTTAMLHITRNVDMLEKKYADVVLQINGLASTIKGRELAKDTTDAQDMETEIEYESSGDDSVSVGSDNYTMWKYLNTPDEDAQVDAVLADGHRQNLEYGPTSSKTEERMGHPMPLKMPRYLGSLTHRSVSALASAGIEKEDSLRNPPKHSRKSSASSSTQDDDTVTETPANARKPSLLPMRRLTSPCSETLPPIRQILKRSRSSSSEPEICEQNLAWRRKRARTTPPEAQESSFQS